MNANHCCEPAPSAWVTRFGALAPPGASVLDVACGGGRHANWFAARGLVVYAVDRETPESLTEGVNFRRADIESGPWPYAGQQFSVVVVANYLYRPLLTTIVDAVAPEGLLIYETFAHGNERFGRPSRPDFLLQPGELLALAQGRLRVLAYEDLYVDAPRPAMVQRIAARRLLS